MESAVFLVLIYLKSAHILFIFSHLIYSIFLGDFGNDRKYNSLPRGGGANDSFRGGRGASNGVANIGRGGANNNRYALTNNLAHP